MRVLTLLEWVRMAVNDSKWLRMTENGSKWLEVPEWDSPFLDKALYYWISSTSKASIKFQYILYASWRSRACYIFNTKCIASFSQAKIREVNLVYPINISYCLIRLRKGFARKMSYWIPWTMYLLNRQLSMRIFCFYIYTCDDS